MAFYSTAASLALKPLAFSVSLVSAAYAAAQISPPDRGLIPATAVALDLTISSSGSTNTDVQIVVDNDADFSSPVYSNTLVDRADGAATVGVGGLTVGTKYYWRVRAAETGTTSWSAWSPVWTFTPDLNSGKGWAYVLVNVGPAADPAGARTGNWYVDENVGFEERRNGLAIQYTDRNVGFPVEPVSLGFGYAYYGDVNELTPVPHIWFLKPKSGRPGDGIRIVCFGVGDLQSTFSGIVEAFFPGTGWTAVPVLSWQTYPPTDEAYTELRRLDEVDEHIDMQHSVIEITVPMAALPPGIPVRIRTNGA